MPNKTNLYEVELKLKGIAFLLSCCKAETLPVDLDSVMLGISYLFDDLAAEIEEYRLKSQDELTVQQDQTS